jgi:hypothetical protein
LQAFGPVRKVELHRYKSHATDLVIKVNPTTLAPFYKLTTQAKYFLRGRTVREAIEEGLLKFDGGIFRQIIATLARGQC